MQDDSERKSDQIMLDQDYDQLDQIYDMAPFHDVQW